MRTLVWLDVMIILKLEKFAHAFQRLTGKTNFWLANVSWVLFMVFTVGSDIYMVTKRGFAMQAIGAIVDVMLCFYGVHFMRVNTLMEKFFLQSPEFLNPNKITPIYVICRIYAMLMTIFLGTLSIIIFSPSQIFLHQNLFFALLALYFNSLNPLPPGKSKVGEWVEAAKKFFSQVKEVAPEPTPEPAGC